MTSTVGAVPRAPLPDGDGSTADGARPALSDRFPRGWLFPLLVFATTWVLILAAWHIANLIYHGHISWETYFGFKDSGWYFRIAKYGYVTSPNSPAFFPLLPALVRGAAHLVPVSGPSRWLWGGLIVQVVSGAASCVALWVLAERTMSRRTADRAVILYCAFPGAMTFGMLYTEPLGIALAAACLLAAAGRKWVLAGVLGGIDTAEHATWLILAAVLAVIAVREIWARRDWRSLIAPAGAPAGTLAYFYWLGSRYHDFLHWFHVERKYWGTHFDFGRQTFQVLSGSVTSLSGDRVFRLLLVACFVAAVAGCVLLLLARPPLILSLYTVALFFYLVGAEEGSKPRFYWCIFGIFIGAAAKLPRWLFWPAAAASALVLAFCVGWWPYHPVGPAP